jgi:hypothetical protein
MVKLFHPDQYSDPEIKAIAGREMIRLHEIIETLSNPERRLRYDLSLTAGLRMLSPAAPQSLRQQFSFSRCAPSDRIEAVFHRVLAGLRLTPRPLAAAVFFACLLCLVLGCLQLGGMRQTPQLPVVKASTLPSQDGSSSQASIAPTTPNRKHFRPYDHRLAAAVPLLRLSRY